MRLDRGRASLLDHRREEPQDFLRLRPKRQTRHHDRPAGAHHLNCLPPLRGRPVPDRRAAAADGVRTRPAREPLPDHRRAGRDHMAGVHPRGSPGQRRRREREPDALRIRRRRPGEPSRLPRRRDERVSLFSRGVGLHAHRRQERHRHLRLRRRLPVDGDLVSGRKPQRHVRLRQPLRLLREGAPHEHDRPVRDDGVPVRRDGADRAGGPDRAGGVVFDAVRVRRRGEFDHGHVPGGAGGGDHAQRDPPPDLGFDGGEQPTGDPCVRLRLRQRRRPKERDAGERDRGDERF